MATINMHTGIYGSPKFDPLSDAAFRLWVHGLCYAKEHLTDGFIPEGALWKLHPKGAKLVAELLKAHVPNKGPLWHQVEAGYQIHDFEDWQDDADTVQTRRRKWREQKRGRRTVLKDMSATDTTQDTATDSVSESTQVSRSGVGGGGGGGTASNRSDTNRVCQVVRGSVPERPHTHTVQDQETAKALSLLRAGGNR